MSKATAAMTTVRDEFRCAGLFSFMAVSSSPGLSGRGAF
jgi:hypothetical protein